MLSTRTSISDADGGNRKEDAHANVNANGNAGGNDNSNSRSSAKLRLWPSTLSLLYECPRCFWLHTHARLPRPRGLFSSLPNALDGIIKANTALYISLKSKPAWLLPELKDAVIAPVAKLHYEHQEAVLVGTLDQLLRAKDGEYFIVDYKTSRNAYSPEIAAKYYSLQMDCYALLCEENGYEPVETAYLVFFTPASFLSDSSVSKPLSLFRFAVTPVPIPVNSENARVAIARALEVYRMEEPPEASPTCEYCHYVDQIRSLEKIAAGGD